MWNILMDKIDNGVKRFIPLRQRFQRKNGKDHLKKKFAMRLHKNVSGENILQIRILQTGLNAVKEIVKKKVEMNLEKSKYECYAVQT